MRQAALQVMTIRKSDDSGEKPKKAKLRRSTSDAIGFLAEKSEKERELKKEELAIKKRELDLAETRQEEAAQQQQTKVVTADQRDAATAAASTAKPSNYAWPAKQGIYGIDGKYEKALSSNLMNVEEPWTCWVDFWYDFSYLKEHRWWM